MITLNDYLYSGDTVFRIIQKNIGISLSIFMIIIWKIKSFRLFRI